MFRIEIPFENIIRKRLYLIVILLSVLLNSPSTLSQGFSHTIQINSLSSIASDAGEKPQSKVWKHGGYWWAALPTSTGTHLWRLDGSDWTNILQLSTTIGNADVKVNVDTTHILIVTDATSILVSAEFVSGSPPSYALWSTRNTEVTIPLDTLVETATIDIDGNGRMWLASDGNNSVDTLHNILVRWSDSPYSVWNGPKVLESGVKTDDICAVTSFDGKIGVIWSNQTIKRYGFKYHIDGNPATTWSADEVPASQSAIDNVGAGMADDHLNIATGSDGTIYVASKTGYNTVGHTNLSLLVRRPAGTWDDLYEVEEKVLLNEGTRPIVLLSEFLGVITVIYIEDIGGNDIVYKESKLTSISFPSQSSYLRRGNTNWDDVSGFKQLYTDEFLVVFSDKIASQDYRWRGVLAENKFAAYYNMDEGSGGTLVDASNHENDGNVFGTPTWETAIDSLGLKSDGINDYTTVPDDNTLDISDKITLAAWIRAEKTGEQVILEKENASTGYSIFLNSSGSFSVRFNGDETKRVNTSSIYSNRLDKWVHFAATYDGSKIRTYVNGLPDDSLAASFTIGTNSEVLSIGSYSDGSKKFMGLLDEVKIIHDALSLSNIKNLAKPSNRPALVAHWAMEENGGAALIDSSSSKNNASIIEGPSWVEGKRGLALNLNGTIDYCIVPNDPTLNISSAITIAAWVKPGKYATQRIIRKVDGTNNLGYSLFLGIDSTISIRFNNSNLIRVNSITKYTGTGDTWMHIAATYDGTTIRLYINGVEENTLTTEFDIGITNDDLTIGADADETDFFKGSLDDLRIYNYALSSTEISDLQTAWSPTVPVTVSNGAGYALDFDGTDDFIDCGNSSSVNITEFITLEAWIKSDKFEATQSIIKKNGSGSGYELSLSSNGNVFFRLNGSNSWRANSTSLYPHDGNTWMHIAATYDGTELTIYINGVAEGTDPTALDSIKTNSNNLVIGTNAADSTSGLFDGAIDEVRIWNVARSADDIRATMCKKLTGSETGLVGYWRFDNVSGTNVSDLTSNNNDGTLHNMNAFNYVWSGGNIGDDSAFDYVGNAGTYSASISHTDGDSISVTTTSGTITGLQVYRVDANSMRSNSVGPENYTFDTNRYWGIRVFGTGTPTYTITYNYGGHAGITDESALKLVYRSNISDPSWTDVAASLDDVANTLTKTGQTGTEYTLATFNGDPLPVELSFFTATPNGNNVELRWRTETEVNNYGFDVERSADKLNWEQLVFIEGNGNSNSPKEYNYIDFDISNSGKYYYRLKQIDNDGTFEYSELVTVDVGIPDHYSLSQNYPNPFNPETRIDFALPEKQMISLKIYNILGELVKEIINEEREAGNYTIKFHSYGLASGIYIYKLESPRFTAVKKMILLR
ncbi:MAG: T9SS type A sorting domain-containing protein [Bacteroidetes bacterium]|nr:T9SS type A sorting domain-containing protein [Bacteroidota bacterium]